MPHESFDFMPFLPRGGKTWQIITSAIPALYNDLQFFNCRSNNIIWFHRNKSDCQNGYEYNRISLLNQGTCLFPYSRLVETTPGSGVDAGFSTGICLTYCPFISLAVRWAALLCPAQIFIFIAKAEIASAKGRPSIEKQASPYRICAAKQKKQKRVCGQKVGPKYNIGFACIQVGSGR